MFSVLTNGKNTFIYKGNWKGRVREQFLTTNATLWNISECADLLSYLELRIQQKEEQDSFYSLQKQKKKLQSSNSLTITLVVSIFELTC